MSYQFTGSPFHQKLLKEKRTEARAQRRQANWGLFKLVAGVVAIPSACLALTTQVIHPEDFELRGDTPQEVKSRIQPTAQHAGTIVLKGCGEDLVQIGTGRCVTETIDDIPPAVYEAYAGDASVKPDDLR